MQNEAGEYVDLYIPRKCSASNRIIGAGDHASVQVERLLELDELLFVELLFVAYKKLSISMIHR